METLSDFIQPFLEWLLRSTLQASVVICLILVIQAVLRNRLTTRWHYALWLILVVRMVLPWAPQSRLSIYNLAARQNKSDSPALVTSKVYSEPLETPEESPATQQALAEHKTVDTTEGQDNIPPAPGTRPRESAGSAIRSVFGWSYFLPLLWLGGALLLGGYIVFCNLRLWRAASVECPSTDRETLELLEECRTAIGLRTIVALVPSEAINTPVLLGFIRPRLLVPKNISKKLTREELRYIFLHELAHVKRHDIALGWLTALLQVLHWFNPLVWLAFHRMRSNRESACDALVLSRTQGEGTQNYGLAIVSLLEHFSVQQPLPGLAGILESKSQLKRRIAMITQFKHNSYRFSPLAAVLIIVLACISLPDAIRTKASEYSSSASLPPITLRQVWSGPDVDPHVAASPDGRFLSYVDWETGDLAVREIATGKTRRLTNKGNLKTQRLFALYSVISPDGGLVAYSWFNEHETFSLCLVGIDGSADRTLYTSEDHGVFPVCWSSDSKQVVAKRRKGGNLEIITVSVEHGSVGVLKTCEKPPIWDEFCYSPNDRFIVYDFPVEEDSGNYDIGIFDTKNNSETSLIKHPASDKLLGWLSKSDEILFLSDRAGSQDIWALKIIDGKAVGLPRTITRDIGQITPQGLTCDGSFFFSRYTRRFTTFIVPFNAQRAEIQAGSKRPLLGSNCYPAWSPDGESLAYVTEKENRMRLCIRNLRTGVERELAGDIGVRSPHWSPDGRFVLFPGFDTSRRDEKDYCGGLYTIDIEKDQATQLFQFSPDQNGWAGSTAELSVDGKTVFYLTPNGIVRQDLNSGRKIQLYQCDSLSRALSLSPDGKTLLFSLEVGSEGKTSIVTLPVSGGEPRELCVFNEPKEDLQVPRAVVWTPDSNYVLFAKSQEKGSAIWRVDAQGGIPEMILESSDDVHSLGVNPNGEEIAYSTYMQDGAIWVLENFLPTAVVARSARQPDFKKIRIPTETPWSMQLSPDGKQISLISRGKLWIMPATGKLAQDIPGEAVELDTGGILVDKAAHAWSADGKWIAFNEEGSLDSSEGKGNAGMYVVQSEGGTPKKVYETYRDNRTVNYRISLSPDGKTLAFSSVDVEKKEQHIYAIPVDGGKPEKLVDMQAREPVYSPDGKMIAFVEDGDMGRTGGGLWVVSAYGGTPQKVAEALNASSPIWSPRGGMIAFLDYGERRERINLVHISRDGDVIGDMNQIEVPEGISGVWLLAGWSPDNRIGAIFERSPESGLYTVAAEGGKAMQVAYGGGQPRWSPDGKRIFYLRAPRRDKGGWQRLAIGSFSSDGGSTTTVPLRSDARIGLPNFGAGNRVSPDGKRIVFSGKSHRKPPIFMHNRIWIVPVKGGIPTQITEAVEENISDMFPCWSPDGNYIAYVRARFPDKMVTVSDLEASIYLVKNEGGSQTLLSTESDSVSFGPIAWSPDGKYIAYYSQIDEASESGVLKLLSARGDGESKIIGKVDQPHPGREFVWSPDSKRIAFNGADGKTIAIMSIEDGMTVNIDTGLVGANVGPQLDWSPDGKRFVFVAGKGEGSEFWLMENFLPAAAAVEPEPMTTVRKIESNWGTFASLSPDGRYLCDVDWDTENLAALELATGNIRHLTDKSSDSPYYPLDSAISPDSSKVAYLWFNHDTKASSLHVVGLDGSGDRILYEGKYPMPRAWSADGEKILTIISEKDVQQMVWISASDGLIQSISSFDNEGLGYPGKFDISPDGRFIAYDRPQAENTSQRDVFLFDLIGNREISVVEHPSNDKLLGWSADGRHILFASYRTGIWDAWVQKVADGEPQGFPKMVKQDIGDVRPIGFTRYGSYYYAQERELEDVFIARLDLETGAVLSQPMPVRQTGATGHHDFSPDGKYLAYCDRRPDKSQVVYVRTLATGQERTLAENLPYIRWLRWSLDGQSLLIDGARRDDSQGVIYKIDIETGELTDLVRSETEVLIRPEMSPDGKTLYYVRNDPKTGAARLMARGLEDGHEKELLLIEPPARLNGSDLSPDGRQFILSILPSRSGPEGPVLKILPTDGGQSKELIQFNISEKPRAVGVTWMPDSRNVLFWKWWFQADKKLELWRISADGGQPRRLWSRKALGHLRVHPDGQRVAFYDRASTRGIWVIENFLPAAAVAESGK